MTSRWFGTLLIAATALTPIAAQAQDGFGEQVLAQARAAAVAATSGGIHSVDVPASNLRSTPVAPAATNSADFQRGDRGGRGGWGGRDGGGGDRGGGHGGWGGRGNAPTASPTPAPAPAPRADGGGWRGRADNGGGGGGNRWQPRVEVPAPAPVVRGDGRGDWQARRGDARGEARIDAQRAEWRARREAPRYQPPVATPAPVDNGRWQGRNGGFGDRVIRDAERANGGNRYDGQRGGDNRYDRQWDRRDGDRYQGGGYGNRRDGDRNDGRRYDNRRYDNGRYANRGYSNWDRSWRNDRRYDWQSHRTRYSHSYRQPVYYSPYRDWSYRRLNIGFSLWPLFYAERYWINDPWQYRLPDVYGPYRWVRYYDDALLVDVETGEIVDVIDNFFW